MDIYNFQKAVIEQNEDEIRRYFHPDAYINWHCTNEHFTVDEFIIANCEYPGEWEGKVERVEEKGNLIIAVTNVCPKDRSVSFHAVSFIETEDDKIISMDEYWADDSLPPQWRLNKNIGKKIK